MRNVMHIAKSTTFQLVTHVAGHCSCPYILKLNVPKRRRSISRVMVAVVYHALLRYFDSKIQPRSLTALVCLSLLVQ